MVTQYPHTLTYTSKPNSVKDINGNWSTGTGTTVTIQCRAEPNTRNAFITVADGSRVVYDYTVYMAPQPAIPLGASVTIDMGGVTLTNTAKMFSQGQLNARLWL